MPVTFERLGAPLPAGFVLGPDASAELRWRLDPSQTSGLAPGAYRVVLSLDTPTLHAKSPPERVTLSTSPAAGPHAAELARIDDAIARGDLAAAEAQVDAVLSSDPADVRALTRKGDLLERKGDLPGAYAAFTSAADFAVRAGPNAPEGGPRHLLRRKDALAGQVSGGGY